MTQYRKDPDVIATLSPEQFYVTQESGTERPGTGAYLGNKEPGIYVDIVSGEPLFASAAKYESGCGWPSFVKPIEPDNVVELQDTSHGMIRTEVRSTAIWGMCSRMVRATGAGCGIASTRPHCGSFTATTWKTKAMVNT